MPGSGGEVPVSYCSLINASLHLPFQGAAVTAHHQPPRGSRTNGEHRHSSLQGDNTASAETQGQNDPDLLLLHIS